MKKLIIILILFLASCISVSAYIGTGTKIDPYLISTIADFLQIPSLNNGSTNVFFKLTADIDMTGQTWSPMYHFFGQLDGDGHTVTGLSSSYDASTGTDYTGAVGLFSKGASYTPTGVTDSTAIFKNIIFNKSSYTFTRTSDGAVVGGLLVGVFNGSVVYATNNVKIDSSSFIINTSYWTSDLRFGGIVGGIVNNRSRLYRTSISHSSISITSSGTNSDLEDIHVGGLVGYITSALDSTFISECYVDSLIITGKNTTNKGLSLGGLVGSMYTPSVTNNNSKIENSYFRGDIVRDVTSTGGIFAGGIVGYSRSGTASQYKNIDKCYSIVNNASNNLIWFAGIYGVHGSVDYSIIDLGYSHYWDGTAGIWTNPTSNKLQSFGNPTVGQYDTSNVSMLSTIEFADTTNFPTWDFTNTWVIEDGFPVLKWDAPIPSYLTMTSPDNGSIYVIGDTILVSWDYLSAGSDSIIYIYDENILVDSTSDSLYYYIIPYGGDRTISIMSKEGITDSSIVVVYILTESSVQILSASSDSVIVETINVQELEYSYSIDSLHWTIVDTLLIPRIGTANDTTLLITSLGDKKYIKMKDAAIIDTVLHIPQYSSSVYTGTISGSNIFCNACAWNGSSLRVVEDNSCGWIAKDYTRFTRSFRANFTDGTVSVQTEYDTGYYDKNYCSGGQAGYSLEWDKFICTALGGSPGNVPPDSTELPLTMDGRDYTTKGRDISIYDPINDTSYVFYTCPDSIERFDLIDLGQWKYVLIWTEGSSTYSASPGSCTWSYRMIKTFTSLPSGKTKVVEDIYTLAYKSKARDYFRGIFPQ